MKIALAQLNPTVGDIKNNCEKIIMYIKEAKKANMDLIVFPELSIIGYPPKDLLYNPDFLESSYSALNELILPETNDIGVIVGIATKDKEKDYMLHNSALLLYNGKIIGQADKTLLPNYDVFDEQRYFEPAKSRTCFDFKGMRLAVNICEDIWNDKDFWERPRYDIDVLEEQYKLNPDIFINISASPYNLGKQELRTKMVKQISKKYKLPLIYVNQVGGNDELIFDGNSFAINSNGDRVVNLRSFSEDIAFVDTENLDELKPLQEIKEDISWVHDALILGLRDYFRKTGFKKAVVGLSGGIDSAVTCALAVKALGRENVLGVSMPSRYSSEGSKDDARDLAQNLGIQYRVIPIEDVFKSYISIFNKDGNVLGDLAEENLQARIRGNYLMFISNREGYMVLTTGNKSEIAVGYCTLYGDMSGGLAVISDVPKTMVYELAKYINRDKIIIPLSTIEKAPSAELRPNQKDTDSLPPYEILDDILKSYIEDDKSISEIIADGYDKDLVRDVIRKVNNAEYKRKQAAPGLKVTTKAFGVGRRMPIAQRFRP
ncbi:NAD+ synthase [Thermoanaerobacterium thermosaccharolyticum]|uniref:Glutamine-dependent NAD(+) synthetase n=1 Tax=Thermoanaerobacterium thermosaccharolyticum (strain ATCC 7956 / DSM 571 / NCIMB 9385 / NCA 3814 / NCTC 13789 / WDCM 00135 / 2032) TaxID=580327 RepID=D9TME9_THETC|nr:NAD+ synthase [Thermoanaerobacterium thermosaccharolyticum]ADL68437.1 NAD+ synthetase [Thermoanaerobacterium thermosaccharolyticum DSM 571]KAA5805689.1 NAD+ synthase [Thermoanaerobacterium thermosaccharolyticum]